MPIIDVNLKDVDDSMPQFDPGVYDLEVVKVVLKPETATQGPRLNVCFKELNTPDEDRRRIYNNFDLEGDFRSYLKRFLRCAGGDPDADQIDTDKIIGLTVRSSVIKTQYEDKQTGEIRPISNITRFLPPES